ncbi:unnamed protein product [Prorocentrum cordatum]|uniref:Uncharacterized protein n=1 Tax=Prorocentrum cordatum TaxID=2364126 RepID=A0ABN9WQ97_9DINO|nr:unnamed protein product [Polarella glacialis]
MRAAGPLSLIWLGGCAASVVGDDIDEIQGVLAISAVEEPFIGGREARGGAAWREEAGAPRVFPLLPGELCGRLIVEAEAAAAARGGWTTDRHARYATTDLEVRAVPGMWALIEPHLRRAAALAAETYGGEPGLEFHDVFVVRYDASGQRSLASHQDPDGSRVTLQAALNEERARTTTAVAPSSARWDAGCSQRWVAPWFFQDATSHTPQGRSPAGGDSYVLVGFSHREGGSAEDEHFALSFGELRSAWSWRLPRACGAAAR